MDVLKFKSVIDDVVGSFNVSKDKKDDLKQECYVALIERMPENVRDEMGYAAEICRNHVRYILRKQNKTPTPDSLDDPRTYTKASRIQEPEGSITEHQLSEAVLDLPYDEYQVIHELFYEGATEEKTAADLRIHRSTVQRRKQRGIDKLKKHFEV